jgi:tetratricopeptide (TPR) repeat protein
LERSLAVLRGGSVDLPERQRTLHSAIDWSYDLLTEEQRRLFRHLSVFAGGWTLEAAETVWLAEGESPADILDGLESLTLNSLLTPPEEVDGEPRQTMLETIREFAYERLIASGEANAAVGRHIHYYVSLAEQAESELHGPAQQIWHRRLDRELDNLRVVMRRSLAQGHIEAMLRISAALWRYWWTQGYWREGLGWLDAGLARSDPAPPTVRAKALNRAGWLKRELGDYRQAVVILQDSLALWRQIGDSAGIALTLSNLGITVMRLGDYSEATRQLEEALDLRRQFGDQRGIRVTLMNLGLVAFEQGNNERAVELYAESLALARLAKDEHSVGIALTNLGEAYMNQGAYDRAEACFAEAAQIYQRLGSRSGEGDVARCRGLIALRRGDCAEAYRFLAEAISTLRDLGEKELSLLAIEALAAVANRCHYPDRAARLLSASEMLRRSIGLARPPVDQREFDACIASAHVQLSETAFAEAWAEGGMMTLDQAAAYAIHMQP